MDKRTAKILFCHIEKEELKDIINNAVNETVSKIVDEYHETLEAQEQKEQTNENDDPMYVTMGSRFRIYGGYGGYSKIHEGEYILAQVEAAVCKLICLKTGNRWDDKPLYHHDGLVKFSDIYETLNKNGCSIELIHRVEME